MQNTIEESIFEALKNLSDEFESLKNPNKETKIYGDKGILDSLALISFITDLEELINSRFNTQVILASEKTMSLKNSPFRDVETLSKYIKNLIETSQKSE